jgi:hypothetical protein
MKTFNEIVWSKKEPINKNDIWFDGTVFKIYKDGEWQAITSSNSEGGGEGGSIDPELLEGFIPLSREFSDDFNNDFAR